MKLRCARTRALYAVSAFCCISVSPFIWAQTPSAAGPATSPEEETIQLSPFVVDASKDQNGYRANSTLAGTRVRTDLKDVASAISVVTEQFLKDTGSHDNSDLLVYTPSTEVAGIRGNFTGVAGTGIFQENTISTSTRVRGLDQADNTRDYFLTDIPWDSFNVGRVDLQRGPNSILFGIGSPAGIINNSVNDAAYKTTHHVESLMDQWGRFRESIDLNQVLVPQVASIRIAGLKDDRKYEQRPAFNNTTRWYGALRLDPKLFSEENHTTIRVKYEDGKVRSNNPRQLPPVDELTRWFTTGADAYGNPGYNHQTINQFSVANKGPDGKLYPGRTGSTLASAMFELGGWAQGRSYWPDIINYYEATPTNLNSVKNGNQPGGTPIKTITAEPNLNLTNNAGVDQVIGFRPMGVPSESQYAAYVGQTSGFPGKAIPGGAYYADTVLTDPSIFNFYKYLLDGPNKNEWQNWKAFNASFEQSFFNDRFAIQIAYDDQKYDNGAHQWMTGSNYAISVDVNETYADGSPNPNVGRPYVANAASAPSLNYSNETHRDTFRVTPTYEFRPEDVGLKGTVAKIVGKHNFTGVFDRYTQVNRYMNWAEYATTADYTIDNSLNDATHVPDLKGLGSGRSFEWLTYVGPSLAGKSTASGANLQPITFKIAPPAQESTWNFNARWNKPTNPNDPGYVDPNAPFTFTNYQNGQVVTSGTQKQNPANYVGWQNEHITWMYDSDPNQFPSLVMAAQRSRFRDTSRGIVWQGKMLDGDLVPTFGWRKDVISNYQTVARTDPITAFTSLDFPDDPTSRTDIRGESKSWGFVYHFPKSLTGKLPGDTTFSVYYDRSKNFKADSARLNLAGLHIPNATGDTKEYGITMTTLNDKLLLKVGWFKTRVANATLGVTSGNSIGGLGNNAYFIADGSIWGYAWAAALQDGILGRTPASNYWDYAAGSGLPHNTPQEIAAYNNFNLNGGTDPNGRVYAGATAVVNAWLKDAPFPPTFFSSYNLSPPVDPSIGSRTGNLRDSYPLGYNDANGPDAGGGSSFGNHQITVDNLSKGTEVELTYQPIRNWNITMNYSKVDAKHENVDAAAQKFIGDMTKFMNGPGGQVREWYNGGQNLGDQWNSSIVAPFAVTMNQLGHEAPEVAPWRLNAISTYTFTGEEVRWLKGVFLGGALRTEGGRIIGYHYDPNYKNVISDDPRYAAVRAVTLGGLNVNQPYRSSAETHIDAWVGYTRKFAHNLDWRIQLNVRNLGEQTRLRTAQVNPDGSIALARISEGMGFELTNAVDF